MTAYRVPDVARATAKNLDGGRVDYVTLGNEEGCCGSVLLRSGQRAVVEKMAEDNVETIKSKGIKRVSDLLRGLL